MFKLELLKNIKNIIIPVIISILGYYLFSFDVNILSLIPIELRGWIIMSVISPLMTSFFSIHKILYVLQKMFIYSHSWDSDINGNDIIEWMTFYINKNYIYNSDNLSKIISNTSSVWWNNKLVSPRPQIYEIPSGWIIFKYKSKFVFAYFPLPIKRDTNDYRTPLTTYFNVYSFHNINWKEFVEDLCNYYYDNTNTEKLAIYRNLECFVDESLKKYTSLRKNTSINTCFGNKEKETVWNSVINFFNIETKEYFQKFNQTYKTSFLIYGPPGTGKTELLFQIASYTWNKYRKPIYSINPKGVDDRGLFELIESINSGYVLVDEWDLYLQNSDTSKENTYPSLNAWLTVLDQSTSEIIFWFTSNNYEALAQYNNGALIRPGRIDHIHKFDKMTSDEVKKAWKYFMNNNEIDKYDDELLNNITIAQIINNIKKKLTIEDLIKEKKESEKESVKKESAKKELEK
jgi:hypothetical protein